VRHLFAVLAVLRGYQTLAVEEGRQGPLQGPLVPALGLADLDVQALSGDGRSKGRENEDH